MSRAFVREPDDPSPRCPGAPGSSGGCGGLGVEVSRATVEAHRAPAAAPPAPAPGADAYLCMDPACPVAYFDALGGRILASELRSRGWPKDPAAPVCPCLGVTAVDVERWAGSPDGKARMREFLARAQAPGNSCRTLTLDGRSCVPTIRRLFLAALDPGP